MAAAPMAHRSASVALARAARSAGFRRVERVRIVRRDGRARAEVTGVLHRYPQTVPVSMATANRLVAAGAPLEVLAR
ncbi:MAG TPA: hypothetical protein VK007_01335 [Acidimicrobiales bacterium]|nr:hypothetical protein [Acidimicrobiales bacterium]